MEFMELEQQVQNLMAEGRKVSAVKLVRETTGWGLKRSKDYVDDLEKAQGATQADPLNIDGLQELVAKGRKRKAIKLVRKKTGWSRGRAKDYVDTLAD